MDFLIGIVGFVVATFAAIAGNMIANDLYDRGSRVANWLLNRAVARLPKRCRKRYREEWRAHLSQCEGNISKAWHAAGFLTAALKISRRKLYSNNKHADLADELRSLIEQYKKLEGRKVDEGMIQYPIEIDPRHYERINRLASRFNCSAGTVASAMLVLGLRH